MAKPPAPVSYAPSIQEQGSTLSNPDQGALLPYVTFGRPLDLPPPLPRSAPMADRYAQLMGALLAQAEALESGIYHPLPKSYLFEAYHYVHTGHASAQRARARRAGLPFPKLASLQPTTYKSKPTQDPVGDIASAEAARRLAAFLSNEANSAQGPSQPVPEIVQEPAPLSKPLVLKNLMD